MDKRLKKPFPHPLTIAVVGPHYAGKSSLCQLFRDQLNFIVIEEQWRRDPFRSLIPRDYFRSEVWYLLQTSKAIVEARKLNAKGKQVVLDTFIYSTAIFAGTKLVGQDLAVFNEFLELFASKLPLPDILIYLYAKPEFLYHERRMERVKVKTGPESDFKTPFSWFTQICQANEHVFTHWNKTPTLKIDVSKTDFKHNQESFNLLVANMQTLLNV